ncbi:MAG: hypothetical protein P4L81_03905 [Candidatus Pacebacteria bacterium]|nr:hypothetical protein [Candidatus Paceibacterota bacterium]
MTRSNIRAWPNRRGHFHQRFASLLGKRLAEDHAFTYVSGPTVRQERKRIEPIAMNVGDGQLRS